MVEFDASLESGEILAHDGAEGLDFLFSPFLQGLVEGFGIGVVAHGGQGGPVEGGTQVGIACLAQATGPAHAAAGLAETDIQASLSGDLRRLEFAWQDDKFRQQGDAADLSDPLGFAQRIQKLLADWMGADPFARGRSESLDASIQSFDAFDFILDQQRQGRGFGAQGVQPVFGLGAGRGQAIDLASEVAPVHQGFLGRLPQGRLHTLSLLGQKRRIGSIRLAVVQLELGKMMETLRMDDRDGPSGLAERHGQVQVINPGGFEHHAGRPAGVVLDQGPMAFRGLGKRLGTNRTPAAAHTHHDGLGPQGWSIKFSEVSIG